MIPCTEFCGIQEGDGHVPILVSRSPKKGKIERKGEKKVIPKYSPFCVCVHHLEINLLFFHSV